MKVTVGHSIVQVTDGSHYRGCVNIGNVRLDYDLVFAVPIPELDKMELPQEGDVAAIRNLFRIEIRKEEGRIELTDAEFTFFFTLLGGLAIDFYNMPQTRDSNGGLLGEMLKTGGSLKAPGISVSVGTTSKYKYDFPPDICEMLRAPKFGCTF